MSLIQCLLRPRSRSKVEESVVAAVPVDVVNTEPRGKLYAAAEEPHGAMTLDQPGACPDMPVLIVSIE